MKKEMYGAPLERGRIEKIENGKYTVASITRNGISSLPIPALNPAETFSIGDNVYFYLFADGTGIILCKFT